MPPDRSRRQSEPPAGGAIKVGSRVRVQAEESYKDAEVIELRKAATGHVEYYVHYENSDRRLDEWVSADVVQAKLELEPSIPAAEPQDLLSLPGPAASVRQRRELDRTATPEPSIDLLEKEHEQQTKVKNIGRLHFGKYEMDTWYYSPYPDQYKELPQLWVCEYCLKYMKEKTTHMRHKFSCQSRHPPGTLIYQKDGLSFWEVDGAEHKLYCQNLCLLAKLFLDHKTLYFDMLPFLFYVLTSEDEEGHHLIGYFSKEKESAEGYNLACILTLPPYQRKGYGRLLIELSYHLTQRERKTGTPERPLSDLGLRGYKSYWKYAILSAMLGHMFHPVTVQELSLETGILLEDVVSTLKELNLDYRRPSPQGELAVFDNLAIRRWLHEHERPRDLRLDPSVLDWRSPKILESEDMEDEDDDQEDEEEEEQEEDEDEIEEEEEEEQPEPKKAAQKKAEQKKVEQKKVEQKNVEAPKEVAIEDDTMDTDSVSGSSDFDL